MGVLRWLRGPDREEMIAASVFLLGVALVTAGVALIFPPAGFIVAGATLICGSWFYVRGAVVAE